MSVVLWIDTDRDEAVELGPTLPVYRLFAEIAHLIGTDWRERFPYLSGVLTQCELQEDASPTWLAGLRLECKAVLEELGPRLSADQRTLLETLRTAGFTRDA